MRVLIRVEFGSIREACDKYHKLKGLFGTSSSKCEVIISQSLNLLLTRIFNCDSTYPDFKRRCGQPFSTFLRHVWAVAGNTF